MTESTTTSPTLGSDRAAGQVSAVVAHRDADGLVTVHYEHKSAPTPGPGDLIVRPEFVGVCGTDLELLGGHLDGDFPISYPLTLGHEWSGTVLTVGPEVTGFSAGDIRHRPRRARWQPLVRRDGRRGDGREVSGIGAPVLPGT